MKEKKEVNLWLISIVVILVLFSIYLINLQDDKKNNISKDEEKYHIVSNYNKFYTVNSCVYRYLTYLQANNTNSLLKVLDEDFISNNGINENNLYNFLTKYEGNLNFNSKKMYEEKINTNITKYYVYGYVEKDVMDSFPEKVEAYFIVNLDEKNSVFTIQPYNGEIFR